MLLMPIGQETTEVRREPWISYGLIVVNLAIFTLMSLFSRDAAYRERLRDKAAETILFLVKRPYLDVPERLQPLCGQELGETQLATDLTYEVLRTLDEAAPVRLLMSVAAFLERQWDGRGALETYELAIKKAPADATAFRALLRRAEVFKKGGDAKRARECLVAARAHPHCTPELLPVVERALARLG